MNYIKEIRQELGLTQTGFAEMLGISRANVSLAEAEIRKLSSDNLVKLRKLKMRSMQNPDELIEGLDEITEARATVFRDKLLMMIERSEKSLAKAERQLQFMIRKYNGACEALKLIRKEQEIFAGIRDYEKKLEGQLNSQKTIYLDNHPSARLKIQLAIDELNVTLLLYRNQLVHRV